VAAPPGLRSSIHSLCGQAVIGWLTNLQSPLKHRVHQSIGPWSATRLSKEFYLSGVQKKTFVFGVEPVSGHGRFFRHRIDRCIRSTGNRQRPRAAVPRDALEFIVNSNCREENMDLRYR
jgi:hypothetical protein